MKKVLCAIPCYNESVNLNNLFKDLKNNNVLEHADILFVDDCSTDNSYEMIKQNSYNVVKHDKNQGYGKAVQTAFKHAVENNYQSFIIFPGDGQRSASDLIHLINLDKEDKFDVISGSKFHIYSDRYGPIKRRIGNRIYAMIAKLGWNCPIQDVLSGFKIYRVDSVKKFFFKLPKGYPFDICFSMYAARFQLKVTEVDVNCRYDDHTSKMNSVLWVSFKMLMHLIYHFVMQPRIVKATNESLEHRKTEKQKVA